MGFEFNINDKIKHLFTRTNGEKQEDGKISGYIKETAQRFGISEDELTQALNVSAWIPSSGVDINGGMTFTEPSDEGGDSVTGMLDAARQRRVMMGITNSGNKVAFGDLTQAAENPQTTARQGVSEQEIETVEENSDKSYQQAVADVDKEKAAGNKKEADANKELQNAQNNAAIKKQNAQVDAENANANFERTRTAGAQNVGAAQQTADRENAAADEQYNLALHSVEAGKKNAADELSQAQKTSDKNNENANNELNTARSRQQETSNMVTKLQGSLSDIEKQIKVLGKTLESTDATEQDYDDYNKAMAQKRKLEKELEEAEKQEEAAKKAVSEAETKVNTTKQEGETQVSATKAKGDAEVARLEAEALSALAHKTSTEAKGKASVDDATSAANTNTAKAAAAAADADRNLNRVRTSEDFNVQEAENNKKRVERQVSADVASAEKRAEEVQASGEEAVRKAKAQKQQGVSSASFRDTVSSNGANDVVELEQNLFAAQKSEKQEEQKEDEKDLYNDVADVVRQNAGTYRPLGTNPRAAINKEAEKLSGEDQHDGLAEKEPEKKYKKSFGI